MIKLRFGGFGTQNLGRTPADQTYVQGFPGSSGLLHVWGAHLPHLDADIPPNGGAVPASTAAREG